MSLLPSHMSSRVSALCFGEGGVSCLRGSDAIWRELLSLSMEERGGKTGSVGRRLASKSAVILNCMKGRRHVTTIRSIHYYKEDFTYSNKLA